MFNISRSEILAADIKPEMKMFFLKDMEYTTHPFKFWTKETIKIKKGMTLEGAVQMVFYGPASRSLYNEGWCHGAKVAECELACLKKSGMMRFNQEIQWKRGLYVLLRPEETLEAMSKELNKEYDKHGDNLSARPNGTMDKDWTELITYNPHIQFYDYTKIWPRMLHNTLTNYDLTWSASNANDKAFSMAVRALEHGMRVAVPINTKGTKTEWFPNDGMDFDRHDIRHKDPMGLGFLTRKDSHPDGNTIAIRKALEASGQQNFFFNQESYERLCTHVPQPLMEVA